MDAFLKEKEDKDTCVQGNLSAYLNLCFKEQIKQDVKWT